MNLIQNLLMTKHYNDLIHSEERVGGSSKMFKNNNAVSELILD